MARRRRAGISRPSIGGGASKFFGDPRGIGERVKTAWHLGVLRERKRRGMPLSPGGPSNVGKSVTTVRAHLRKGRTVRQHQRHLSPAAKSVLATYRKHKAVAHSARSQWSGRGGLDMYYAERDAERYARELRMTLPPAHRGWLAFNDNVGPGPLTFARPQYYGRAMMKQTRASWAPTLRKRPKAPRRRR